MQNAMAVPLILPISLLSGESEVIFSAQWVGNPLAAIRLFDDETLLQQTFDTGQ
jgi:hypothetical protein